MRENILGTSEQSTLKENLSKQGIELVFTGYAISEAETEYLRDLGIKHPKHDHSKYFANLSSGKYNQTGQVRFLKEAHEVLSTGGSILDVPFSPGYEPALENLDVRRFSYVSITTRAVGKSLEFHQYVVFEPNKYAAQFIAQKFAEATFGDLVDSVNVYAKNHVRRCRALFKRGAIIEGEFFHPLANRGAFEEKVRVPIALDSTPHVPTSEQGQTKDLPDAEKQPEGSVENPSPMGNIQLVLVPKYDWNTKQELPKETPVLPEWAISLTEYTDRERDKVPFSTHSNRHWEGLILEAFQKVILNAFLDGHEVPLENLAMLKNPSSGLLQLQYFNLEGLDKDRFDGMLERHGFDPTYHVAVKDGVYESFCLTPPILNHETTHCHRVSIPFRV